MSHCTSFKFQYTDRILITQAFSNLGLKCKDTLTGGEPLLQVKQVRLLLNLIRRDLDVLLFSGFTWEEIRQDTTKKQLLTQIDAALFGRYNKNLPHPFYGKKLVLNGNRIWERYSANMSVIQKPISDKP